MKPTDQLFELRTYYPSKGKRDELINRFRVYTFNIFKKLAMYPEAFWVPTDKNDDKFFYLLSFSNQNAFDTSWDAMEKAPDWLVVKEETNKNGNLVSSLESLVLKRTSFSPIKLINSINGIFELRTYQSTGGNHKALLNLFDNHLIDLFSKYGIKSIFYGIPASDDQKNENTLVCLLAHPSEKQGLEAFKKLEEDQNWQDIKKEAISKANGPLIKTIESVYLHPEDFSPLQ